MTNRAPTPSALDRVPLPALLLATRGTYTNAIRAAQARVGLRDVPPSGEFILSAMEWSGSSIESVVRFLGVTKQAVSQAVDTLVVRGYLERGRDPGDRRRVQLTLTSRGHAAGRAARSAIEQVDRELLARVGARNVAGARATLRALLDIKRKTPGPGSQGVP